MLVKMKASSGGGSKAPMYPFATATDEQLAAMLNSYYNGYYDASEITTLKTTYLPVGAKRSIALSAMSATGVSESHHADNYDVVIIGQEHDNLTTAIGSKTKALLTVQLERILYKNTTDETYTSSSPAVADEGGYMNDTATNVGGWSSCLRRTWCNDVFYSALPTTIRSLVKTVNKLTSAGNQLTTIVTTQDKVFLLSAIEVQSTPSSGVAGEGSRYEYYDTADNRKKKPVLEGYASAYWWLRSPRKSDSKSFIHRSGTSTSSMNAQNAVGICPAFCL